MRIAIIGAGLSGLIAARELQAAGHSVKILEKSRGRGGRLASKRFDWAQVDLGAQYFTARSPGFQKEVTAWLAAGCATRWDFDPYKYDGNTLTRSPDNTIRYIGLPQMNSIAHHLSDGLHIEFKHTITALKKEKHTWTLISKEGQRHANVDLVLVSAPAEQAKVLLAGHTPLADTIPDHVHHPCWAVAMATQGHVPNDIEGLFGDDVVSWVSRQSAKPTYKKHCRDGHKQADDIWVIHFSPQWSYAHSKEAHNNEYPDTEYTQVSLLDHARAWLNKTLQTSLTVNDHYLHFWRYANLRDTYFDAPYLFDKKNNIAAVGAWCAKGKVEGAYVSATEFVAGFL